MGGVTGGGYKIDLGVANLRGGMYVYLIYLPPGTPTEDASLVSGNTEPKPA